MKIRFSIDADRQLDEALRWWAEHRRNTSDLLAAEIETGLEILMLHPLIGQPVRRRGRSIRRLLLPRSGYALYYRADKDAIEIVALWHQKRGKAPRL